MKIRTIALFLAVVLAIFALAGCSGESGSSQAGRVDVIDNGEPIGLQKYVSPVTLTTFMSSSDTLERDLAMTEDGETVENNRFHRWFEEALNIKLSYMWVAKGDAYNTKLNLAISSGQLPDVFLVNSIQAQQLYKAGKIQPLTEIYNTYATDYTKAYMESDAAGNDVFDTVTFDGELYGIPKMWSSYDSAEFLWVRQDWFDKYNLPAPTTMQNMLAAAERFAAEDPDGNGKQDTVGLGFLSTMNSSIGGMVGFFNGYHAYLGCFLRQDDGKLAYSNFLPEVKDALSSLSDLYQKGIISKEFATTDQSRLTELIISGKVGMFYGEHWMPLNPLQDSVQLDKNAVWKAYPLPSVDDTPASTQLNTGTTSWWVVNKNCANPEAIMKLINLSYTDESEAPDYITKQDVTNYYSFNPILVQDPTVNIKQMDGFKKYLQGEQVDTQKNGLFLKIEQYESYKNGNPNYWWVDQIYGIEGCPIQILKDNYLGEDRIVMNDFHGVSTPSMVKNSATLSKLVDQTFVEIITGSKDVSALDDLQQQWLTLGGQSILDEVNA